MLLSIGLLIVGLALLVWSADTFLKGAVGVARLLGVPTLIIGLTLVSIGTSLPELAIAMVGAITGSTELSVGNVIGANVANLGLVLGLVALLAPVAVGSAVVQREIPYLIAVTFAFWALADDLRFQPGATANLVTRGDAAVLLIFLGIFFYYLLAEVRAQANEPEQVAARRKLDRSRRAKLRLAGLLIAGVIGLTLGGNLTVSSAVDLAERLGMAQAAIGATVVAIGTTLPELSTSVVAAYRKQGALAIGNIIGSAVFNTVGILGLAAAIRPLAIGEGIGTHLALFLGLCALVWLFARGDRKIGRLEGAALLCIYLGYLAFNLL